MFIGYIPSEREISFAVFNALTLLVYEYWPRFYWPMSRSAATAYFTFIASFLAHDAFVPTCYPPT